MENKKKKPFIVRLFFSILVCVLILTGAAFGWIVFAAADRLSLLNVLPGGSALVIHTDSVWNALSPVLDLQAADTLLADPAFTQYRSAFISLRTSPLRRSRLARIAASRRADIAFYPSAGKTDYVAVVDMSCLSAVTRLSDLIGPYLHVEKLSYIQSAPFSYFEYRMQNSSVFIAQKRNFVVASGSVDMLTRAMASDNSASYSPEEKKLLAEKTGGSFRIVADAAHLARQIAGENPAAERLLPFLTGGAKSVVSFNISDASIGIKADFPFTVPQSSDSPFAPLLSRNSQMPALLTQLGAGVQYYTLLNAGSPAELKAAVFPLAAKKNPEALWQKGDSLSRMLFSLSLDDILFSWTGNEFALLGIEGNSDPVFVMQIRDEQQRQKIFNTLTSSLVVENNTNLIIGGVRLPRLEMPQFLSDILASFDITLPRPYYLVRDGYIYFSESPQNLAVIYNDSRSGQMLARNDVWRSVSSGQNAASAVSMYYDLQRSVPFFLENGSLLSKILRQYNIGRCDFRIKNGLLTCQLRAESRSSADMRLVPGFPVQTSAASDYNLQAEAGKNPGAVFWVEGGTKIRALELTSMNRYETTLPDSCTVTAADENTPGGGVLWAVTAKGAVYLFNRKLESIDPFPVVTGTVPSAPGAAYLRSLLIPTRDGTLVQVDPRGTSRVLTLPDDVLLKSSPSVLGDYAAVYSKGFQGAVYLIKDGSCINSSAPMLIDGIGFGSPALVKRSGTLYTAFITQAGQFYLFADGKPVSGFPVAVPDVFYTNVVGCGNSYFALSQTAQLYRIGTDGSYTQVKIPGAISAKEGFIASSESPAVVTVCADGNVTYGFTESLEVYRGFPFAGRGRPVFADVNGDRADDCLVLSADKELYAWTLK